MSTVSVHTNECKTCGNHGLASDNWRETGLFNYNNSYLVELAILYRCLEAFTRGTTISAFFETLLEPLASDLVWIKANPDLSKRCLEAFTRGTTISAFFETLLEPLASDLVWIKANPDLSKRAPHFAKTQIIIDPVFQFGIILGPVSKAVNLAATRAVAALREAGIRVISLFEVLIFTYVGLRNIAEDKPGMLELVATGWTLRRPFHGVVPVGTTAESLDAVSTSDAEKHLRKVLVVARGARNGKGACLPDWLVAEDFVDGDTSTLYAIQVDGLHAYAAEFGVGFSVCPL
ncbi:unnamed protein product [Ectocarpus sp. CCAP 1310/34]|nr:unnamed protein product [Ectocarpus sp. CCAP 1310/34]